MGVPFNLADVDALWELEYGVGAAPQRRPRCRRCSAPLDLGARGAVTRLLCPSCHVAGDHVDGAHDDDPVRTCPWCFPV